MAFQSIISPREGWKSQRLFAKVCHSCLSRRTPALTHAIRRNTTLVPASPSTTTTTIPKPSMKSYKPLHNRSSSTSVALANHKLLESLRNELYHASFVKDIEDPSISTYSSLTRKSIERRQSRRRLLKLYALLKETPVYLTQLTQADVDELVSRFMSNPDDLTTNTPFFDAYHILEDLKCRKFKNAHYRLEDAERLIYLATELNYSKRADELLLETTRRWKQVSTATYEMVMRLFSKHKQQGKIDFWLDHIRQKELSPTRSMVRSVILCMMATDQSDAAAQYLKRNHPGQDLAQLVVKCAADDWQLLDEALSVFAMDCMDEWRLNDMRLIYKQKRHSGMSTIPVVKNLLDKSLHTGQLHTAKRLLSDTFYMQDTTGAQLCSEKIIEWYLSRKDIAHAVKVWEQMEHHKLALSFHLMHSLLIQAAKLKYHVDTLRLYRRCKDLYPESPLGEAKVHILRCLIRSNQLDAADIASLEVEKLVPDLKPNLARTAVRALFSLSAHNGDADLCEKALQLNNQLGLSLTHIGLTSLIACYIEQGDIQSAKSTFKVISSHMDGPDVIDFNLLMRMTVLEDEKGASDKILDILTHMKLVNVAPDLSTMRTMLASYESVSSMRDGLYDKLLNAPSASRADHVFLNNLAITDLLASRSIEDMTGLLLRNDRGELFPSEAKKPIAVDGLTFKILLDVATLDGKNANVAEKLFKSMRLRGMKPERQVYENLIDVLAKKGKIQKARTYMTLMEKEVGCKADAVTYTKLVNGLLRLGKPDLAKEIILHEMPLNQIPLNPTLSQKLRLIESLSCANKSDILE